MRCFFFSLLLAVSAKGAVVDKGAIVNKDSGELQIGSRISPELEPKSDKKFFGKDYPADKRPATNKYYYFSHPYPAVQDSGDYDKDFIKDENSDNGYWDAQMAYDKMRHQIGEAKKKLDELKKKMDGEYKDYMSAKGKSDKAEDALEDANAAAAKAKAEADAAEKNVNDLEGNAQADGTKVGGAIGNGVKKVEKEMSELDDCKKKLEEAKERLKKLLEEKEERDKKDKEAKEAKERLKKLLEEKEERDKKDKEAKEAAEKARKKQLEDAKAKHEGKKKELEDAEKKAAKEAGDMNSFDEEAWRKKLEELKAEYEKAGKRYEKEQSEVKKTEDELARAAETLRKYRRPPYVDDDGGVYYRGDKSSAFQIGWILALCVSVVAAFVE